MTTTVRHATCAVAFLGALLTATAARAACPGDCDDSGSVVVNELIRGVNIALGNLPLTECPAFNTNGNTTVEVNELVAAVNAALNSCPAQTPTTAPASPSPTPTFAITPIFPADYRNTFTEVRDCRLGIEHGGVMIRVLANAIAAEPYRRLQNPLPVGSIVVKEEYEGADCSNEAELTSWSAMRKESPGFDPVDGDWHWQQVAAPSRAVTCDDKRCPGFVCITCHSLPDCTVRDYMCTVDDTPRGTLQPVLQNLPAALLSIAGTSPTDVYAVGADPNDGRGPYVLHYDGSIWKRLDTGATGALWWISVTPIDGAFYMAGDAGLILQYDTLGKQFTRHTTPAAQQLFGIWGTAANNLWAVGGDDEQQAVLWYFNGTMWTVVDLSAVVPQGTPTTLYKVWGRSASDVFAVGETGVLLHFDGASWSLVNSAITNTLFTVHGAGTRLAAVGGFFLNGVILEQRDDGALVFDRRTPSGAPQLNGVFVPPSGDAVAVGNGLAVAARNSSGWTLVDDGSEESQGRDFHATWIDADDGIWAVGGDLSLSMGNGILAYDGPQAVGGGPVQ